MTPVQALAASETLHRLNRLAPQRLKLAAALLADLLSVRYTIVRVDPVTACNLRCGMCYFSDPRWLRESLKGRLSEADLERIAQQLFPQALQVHFGAQMEPTTFRNYPWLVELAKRHGVPFVGFTTNGQLLTEAKLDAMAAAGLDEITLSTHGTRRETYERMMARASYARHLETLAMIRAVRKRWGRPRLRINYTANPDNMQELREFFDVYGPYDVSTLQVRPIFDLGDTAYKCAGVDPDEFRKLVPALIRDCREHRVKLLINLNDPLHSKPNYAGYVYTRAFLRLADPTVVWQENFHWRDESIDEYRRRSHWRRSLLSDIVAERARWALEPSQAAKSSVF